MMNQGKVNGYICQGFNPVASFPNKNKVVASLSKLKFLVTIDPLNTETSTFWQNHGESNDVDRRKSRPKCSVCPPPASPKRTVLSSTPAAGCSGTGKARTPRGCAEPMAKSSPVSSYACVRCTPKRAAPAEPVLNMTWNYSTPHEPASEEVAMESNGKALADITDPATGAVIVKKGQQLSSFAQLRDDGTTSSGCWIFAGSWTPEGNQMAAAITPTRRLAIRWAGHGRGRSTAASCITAPPRTRRVNRGIRSVSSEMGRREMGRRGYSGLQRRRTGQRCRRFIMQPEGMGRLFAIDKMAEGPFPEHYEPFETPLGTNPLHPNVVSNPAARVFKGDAKMGKADKFPYVGTTYRLTEHFHYWTKHALLNAIAQPEQFVEIGESWRTSSASPWRYRESLL
jgi:formate dehydrogenase major subunit